MIIKPHIIKKFIKRHCAESEIASCIVWECIFNTYTQYRTYISNSLKSVIKKTISKEHKQKTK